MTNIESKTNEPVISVDNVDMVFNIANEQLNSLKEYFIKAAKRELFFREFKALENVSFTVSKGDVYGIVGTNGSGKSTLLKIIAGVLEPSKGTCTVTGSIAPLIELGAGFDPELTARENVYLNGALLGYKKEFIDENFDSIIDFAEVGPFVDMPLKNYSSGMVARIAFAIATATTPDILVVDEALSVGDVFFQEKCERRIDGLIKDSDTTVLFVSHSIDQVERICDRAIWIERGHKVMEGPVSEVCAAYRNLQYVDYTVSRGIISKEHLSFDCLSTKLTCEEMIRALETCVNPSGAYTLRKHLSSLLEKGAASDAFVSKELVAEMLYYFATLKRPQEISPNDVLSSFKDNQLVDPKMVSGVRWCIDNRLMCGIVDAGGSRTFLPREFLSRIDYARLVTKLFKNVLSYPDDVNPTSQFAKEGYYDYVLSRSLMMGYASGQFGPKDEATRGQIATVIWRCFGEPAARAMCPYQDVEPDAHYAVPIAWALENKVLPVNQGSFFRPNSPLAQADFKSLAENLATYAGLDENSIEELREAVQEDEYSVTRASLAKLATVLHRAL